MDSMEQIVMAVLMNQDEPTSMTKLMKIIGTEMKRASRRLVHEGRIGVDGDWNLYITEDVEVAKESGECL